MKITNNNPYIIEETPNGETQYNVLTRLAKDRIIMCIGEVNTEMATYIMGQLLLLDAQSNLPIQMYINSPGGSVTDGLAIMDTMNLVASPIHTTVIGMAASMGTIIASSGEKGYRTILPNATFMIHQPMTGIAPGSQQTDILITSEQITKTRHKLETILTENSNLDFDTVHRMCERDCYLNAEDTVKHGFADVIATK